MNIPKSAPSVAASRSASEKKMFGDFPPSSSETFLRLESATPFNIARPVSVPPVNATLAHSVRSDHRAAGNRSVSCDDIEDAGRQLRNVFLNEPRKFECRQRSLLSGFKHGRATRRQRRSQFPRGQHER